MLRKNDISFTIDRRFIVLMEHQSSINLNMPLRFLLYIARVYEKMIDNKTIYRKNIIHLPTPEFIVLYNGAVDYPEETILQLSNAFIEKETAIDLTVRVVNINYEKSKILEKSQTLKEYSYFVYEVNQFHKQSNSLEQAIELAIKKCIENNVLKNFLKLHGSEVVNMLFTEFKLEDALEVREEEGREKGREEGRKEGSLRERRKIAIALIKIMDDDVAIAEVTHLSPEEVKRLRNSNK